MAHPFLAPTKLWAADELWLSADSPPPRPGVYAWYFDTPPGDVPVGDCVVLKERHLLYVGISPARPGSKQELRRRLRQHFRGTARSSTLRKTLGCLLQDELGLDYRRTSAKSMRFTQSGEETLSRWMHTHARVAWVTDPKPWEMEERLIGELSLPLNLRGNKRHPFYATLRKRRADMTARCSG